MENPGIRKTSGREIFASRNIFKLPSLISSYIIYYYQIFVKKIGLLPVTLQFRKDKALLSIKWSLRLLSDQYNKPRGTDHFQATGLF